MPNYRNIAALALDEMRQRSRNELYKTDPEAWLWDVLGRRWWSKQAEVGHSFVENPLTIVASCNGIGKSAIAGDLATWMCSVFPPEDTSVMLTAPVFSTIKKVVARYIGDNYMTARSNGVILPGRVVSDPAVRVDRKFGGSKDIIQAKRPADSNLISSFQGTHDKYVGLFIDEAGGVPTDLWTGAMAITTNEWAHILAIGNPDELNTGFHERMTQPERYQSWNRITISAYDSPNLTGEVVYPDDPAADADLKSKLVQKDWVEMMEREAHPDVVRAKVYGEFPESDDSSFFPPLTIRTALDTEIVTVGSEERWLGVDLAWSGSDYTRAYLNVCGRVRQVEQFQYTDDYMEQARWIHRIAIKHGCTSVRVDASGGGKGIHSLLDRQEEFAGKPYQLIGFRGGERSPDNSRWAQARSWAYDFLRQEMALGRVDIDDDDVVLRDQLARQTFSINKKGAIQITPKDEMRKAGLHSPDELDAVTMAVFDPVEFTSGDSQKVGASAESPLGGLDDFEWQGVLTSPGMVYAGDGLQSGSFLGVNGAV